MTWPKPFSIWEELKPERKEDEVETLQSHVVDGKVTYEVGSRGYYPINILVSREVIENARPDLLHASVRFYDEVGLVWLCYRIVGVDRKTLALRCQYEGLVFDTDEMVKSVEE